MAVRRLISITTFVGLTLLLTAALPALLLLALVISLVPAFRGAVPTLGFILGYLWCETIGICLCFYVWLRYHNPDQFQTANFRVQCWWANSLKRIAEGLFRLTFIVENQEVLQGPPVLMLPRHASIADTVIPIAFYAIPFNVRLRYVLKKELLLDPCLDIVGQRLPNYFVDRGGQDSAGARKGVAQLVRNLGPGEGALIYPEGTRYSRAKHDGLRERYRDSADLRAQLDRWTHLLPPRLGGTLAMLQANPGLDVAFCAHTGFEGSSHFSNLINGSWIGAHIRIRFWRVPYNQIPENSEDQKEFLFRQWDRMQDEVLALSQ